MIDLKALREEMRQKYETTTPQKMVLGQMAVDGLISAINELAKLGMVISVEDVTPKPIPPKAPAAKPAA